MAAIPERGPPPGMVGGRRERWGCGKVMAVLGVAVALGYGDRGPKG